MATEQEEEWLESIYKLQERGDAVTAATLARELGVSEAVATDILHRLVDRGLVRHTAEKQELTLEGTQRAATVVRRHRLAERLLTDILGLGWDRSHAEACKLEHVLSPEVEERLAVILGHPETCPHGYPVPGDGASRLPEAQPLSALLPPSRAIIVRIAQEDGDLLRYLATLGLMPETEVEVEERAPFDGPLMIRVGNAHYALGRQVADQILVRPLEGPPWRHRRRRRGGGRPI